jgi:hypothetical protein
MVTDGCIVAGSSCSQPSPFGPTPFMDDTSNEPQEVNWVLGVVHGLPGGRPLQGSEQQRMAVEEKEVVPLTLHLDSCLLILEGLLCGGFPLHLLPCAQVGIEWVWFIKGGSDQILNGFLCHAPSVLVRRCNVSIASASLHSSNLAAESAWSNLNTIFLKPGVGAV